MLSHYLARVIPEQRKLQITAPDPVKCSVREIMSIIDK